MVACYGTIHHLHMTNPTWTFSEHPTTVSTGIGFRSRFQNACCNFHKTATDVCRHPLSISIKKQDDTLTLLRCRIAASRVSALSSVCWSTHGHSAALPCCSDLLHCVLQGPNCLAHIDLLLLVWKHSNDRPSCFLTRDARRRKMP